MEIFILSSWDNELFRLRINNNTVFEGYFHLKYMKKYSPKNICTNEFAYYSTAEYRAPFWKKIDSSSNLSINFYYNTD